MTDNQIKAIETRWNGYRFRSRLEARWAIFFHTLGIAFDYEPQGYRYDGHMYLPDFYMPDLDCYFEIKPDEVLEDPEIEKIFGFQIHIKKPVYVIAGSPWPNAYYIYGVIMEPRETLIGRFASCQKCDDLWLRGVVEDWGVCLTRNSTCNTIRFPIMGLTPRLEPAYRAARGARFEHGEKG